MALYRGLPGREEDADDPEKIVRRVQEVSAVLYHLEQVGGWPMMSWPDKGQALCLWAGPEGVPRLFWEGQGVGLESVSGACMEP